jgi:hypothetical protein
LNALGKLGQMVARPAEAELSRALGKLTRACEELGERRAVLNGRRADCSLPVDHAPR